MANVQKRVLYVGTGFTVYTACRAALMASLRRAGGLEEGVTKEILHAAFIPFGELLDVQVPQDHATRAQMPALWTARSPGAPLCARPRRSLRNSFCPGAHREEPGVWLRRIRGCRGCEGRDGQYEPYGGACGCRGDAAPCVPVLTLAAPLAQAPNSTAACSPSTWPSL